MSTVYLHMGMPKTATTALQRFFFANREELNQRGFGYPVMPFHFEHVPDARNAHFLVLFDDREQPEWKEGFSVIKKEAAKYDKLLMSDERLWSVQRKKGFWKQVKQGFSDIGVDLKVIVYFRRQDEQVESHWNQKVKEPKTHMSESFAEYLEQGMHQYMPFHYNKALKRIAKRIGKENIIVRVYEKQQFVGGSIFADFLDAIGITFDEKFQLPEYTANVRLPGNAVEIKRLINAMIPEGVPDFYWDAIAEAYGMKHMSSVPVDKTSMFPKELRREFMKKYEKGNANVAKNYLNREDGVLFYSDYNEVPQWECNDREMLLDVIRILASADILIYRRQERIFRILKEIRESLPGRIARKVMGKSLDV